MILYGKNTGYENGVNYLRDNLYCRSVFMTYEDLKNLILQFDGLLDAIQNVTDEISSLRIYPIDLDIQTTDNFAVLDNPFDFASKGVKASTLSHFTYRNLGEFFVEPHFNSFLDYKGYTHLKLFLPFLGFVDLDTNECMGKYLQFRFDLDYKSGTAAYIIGVSDESLNEDNEGLFRIISTYEFTLGIDCPLGTSNTSQVLRNIALNTVKAGVAVGTAAFSMAVGNPISSSVATTTKSYDVGTTRRNKKGEVVGTSKREGAVTTTHASMSQAEPNVIKPVSEIFDASINLLNIGAPSGHSDRLNSSNLLSSCCYDIWLIRYKPNIVEDYGSTKYNHLYGRPLGKFKKLNELKGFTEIGNFHPEFKEYTDMTQTEKSLIIESLMSGVILPEKTVEFEIHNVGEFTSRLGSTWYDWVTEQGYRYGFYIYNDSVFYRDGDDTFILKVNLFEEITTNIYYTVQYFSFKIIDSVNKLKTFYYDETINTWADFYNSEYCDRSAFHTLQNSDYLYYNNGLIFNVESDYNTSNIISITDHIQPSTYYEKKLRYFRLNGIQKTFFYRTGDTWIEYVNSNDDFRIVDSYVVYTENNDKYLVEGINSYNDYITAYSTYNAYTYEEFIINDDDVEEHFVYPTAYNSWEDFITSIYSKDRFGYEDNVITYKGFRLSTVVIPTNINSIVKYSDNIGYYYYTIKQPYFRISINDSIIDDIFLFAEGATWDFYINNQHGSSRGFGFYDAYVTYDKDGNKYMLTDGTYPATDKEITPYFIYSTKKLKSFSINPDGTDILEWYTYSGNIKWEDFIAKYDYAKEFSYEVKDGIDVVIYRNNFLLASSEVSGPQKLKDFIEEVQYTAYLEGFKLKDIDTGNTITLPAVYVSATWAEYAEEHSDLGFSISNSGTVLYKDMLIYNPSPWPELGILTGTVAKSTEVVNNNTTYLYYQN